MHDTTIVDLQAKPAIATAALRKSEERATAGLLAVEVMHDVRNPLECLRNLNYLISVEANNPDEVRRYTALADEQMAIAIDIANSTLEVCEDTPSKPIGKSGLLGGGRVAYPSANDRGQTGAFGERPSRRCCCARLYGRDAPGSLEPDSQCS
jgi:hypothetical protein